MNKKDIQDHKVVASQMNWDDLAEIIMLLETEVEELEEHLKKHEIEEYNTIIDIYEVEKALRVDSYGCVNSLFGFEYGVDYVSNWNDEY